MNDEQIIAIFKAHGVLRIPARSISDPDGLGFMVAIGRELFRAGMERAAVIADEGVIDNRWYITTSRTLAAAIRAEAAKEGQ